MLSGPHLVLPNAGRDEDVLLAVGLAPGVERLDDLLGLHELAELGLRGLKCEGVEALPLVDLGEPLGAFGGLGGEEGEEGAERVVDVAGDGDIGVDDLVDVLGLDLKVDDATAAGCCCLSGCGCES